MRNLKFFPCLFFAVLFLGSLTVRANISKRISGEVAPIYGPHKDFSVPFLNEKEELKAAVFAPTITQQPSDKSMCAGETVVFTVQAEGSGLSYHWYADTGYGWFGLDNYEPYSGVFTNTLVVKDFPFSSAKNGYPLFRAVVTDNSGTTTSNTARLCQNTPTSGWVNGYGDRTICAGQNTLLEAYSSDSRTIQWEVSTDGGNFWSDVVNDSNHVISSGTVENNISSRSLEIVNASVSMNNNVYRAKAIVAAGSCPVYGTSARLTVTSPITSTADQTMAGNDSWIGHLYDGTAFNNYVGYYNESESINQNFGGGYACYDIQSGGSIYTETFSVRYRMASTRKGLYTTNIGSDDGSRLYVDGALVYNNWSDQAYLNESNDFILMNLKGNSHLSLEYYDGGNVNRISFTQPNLILENKLTQNISQTFARGGTGQAIGGDTYESHGILPSGISRTGTGYQWFYSTTPGGAITSISGATGATFTPNSDSTPFNIVGTYYLYRQAALTSTNNVGISSYKTSNLSNTAILTVTEFITKHPEDQNVCAGTAANFSVEALGNGLSYQWEGNTGSGWVALAEGINYNGATSSTLSVLNSDLSMDGHQFRVVITDGTTVEISNAAILQVSEDSGIVFTQEGGDKTICPGTSTSFEIVTTETYSYQWQVSTNGGATYSNLSNGTHYNNVTTKKLEVINAPSSFHGNLYRVAVDQGGCTGYSNALKITLPTRITSQPINQSAFSGSTIVFSADVAGTNLSYLWENWQDSDTGGSWWNITDVSHTGSTSTTLTLNNVPNWLEIRKYRLRVTDNTSGCTFYSNEVRLYIDEPLSNNIIGEAQEYCGATNAETLTGTNVTGGTSSTYTYLWQSSTTSSTSGFTSAPGTNTFATYNPGILSQTTWFRRIVSSQGYGSLTSNTIKITINSSNTWIGDTSTDWNTASNWSCSSLPTLGTDVLIPSGLTNYPILSSGSDGLANNITIETGASIEVHANQLQIAGTLTNSGILNVESGSLAFVGNTAQIIPSGAFANNRIQNLTINNAAGVTSEAIIELTGILKAENGNFETGGNFTLISDSIQTALIDGSGNGEVTGLVDMQRFMDVAFGYKYFSSPVQNAIVGDFTPYVDLAAAFPNFYRYNENREIATPIADTLSTHASGWEAYTGSTSALNTMEAYAVNFGITTGPVTVELSGEVNNGSFSKALANHNKQYTKGFHLVGNPYPSPIDWDATSGWTKTNIDNGIYFFTAGSTNQYTGTYTSYVEGIASDGKASNIIPSMQGFFIKVSDSDTGTYPVSGTLGTTNAVRINNFSQPFLKTREPELKPLLRLSARFGNTEKTDAMVIYFSPQSNTDFEKEKDAHKMMNTDVSVPNLYSISTDKKQLSISGLPFPDVRDYTKIPLGIKAEKSGKMTIALQDIQNLPLNFNVYLIDQEKKIGQNLMDESSYSFSIEKGENNSRFHLIFSEENITDTAIAFDEPFSLEIGQGNLKVRLNLEDGQKGILRASAVTGQILQVREGKGQETVEFSAITSPGVYFINLYVGDRGFSKKVLIKN